MTRGVGCADGVRHDMITVYWLVRHSELSEAGAAGHQAGQSGHVPLKPVEDGLEGRIAAL